MIILNKNHIIFTKYFNLLIFIIKYTYIFHLFFFLFIKI